MNKIIDAFNNKKAFIAYLMAGDPNLETSAEYILTAQEAGADLIEIGIPFSDPIAEGEVIQQASLRAFSEGTRLDGIFKMVKSLNGKIKVPLVFMTYLNPVFVYGYDRFFAKCQEIGIGGIIIPDLPYEEENEVKCIAKTYGVETITLVAPTSEERIKDIAINAEGFLYLVSSLGVTGVRQEITTDINKILTKIKKFTNIPVAVGFGISKGEQVREYSTATDGVIVGSAIVKIIGEYGQEAKEPLFSYINSLKQIQKECY